MALYDPRSRGAEAYATLAREIMQRNEIVPTPKPMPEIRLSTLESLEEPKRGIWPFRKKTSDS